MNWEDFLYCDLEPPPIEQFALHLKPNKMKRKNEDQFLIYLRLIFYNSFLYDSFKNDLKNSRKMRNGKKKFFSVCARPKTFRTVWRLNSLASSFIKASSQIARRLLDVFDSQSSRLNFIRNLSAQDNRNDLSCMKLHVSINVSSFTDNVPLSK